MSAAKAVQVKENQEAESFDDALRPDPSTEEADQRAIERLAYAYWEERGCPEGSGEEDWLRAEKALRGPEQDR